MPIPVARAVVSARSRTKTIKYIPKMFYDILFDAMEAKDDEYYTIYADMLKSGLTEEKIKAAMEDRMKKKQGVNSVKDLEKRWEAPRPK